MKTKELVKKLLEIDPDGEADVCVDNIDIINVIGLMPTYYDGQFVQVICKNEAYDEHLGGYNTYGVTKVIARTEGKKISIRTMDAEEAFLNNPNAIFEQEAYNPERHKHWEKRVEKWREEGKNHHIELKMEEEYFQAKKKKQK